MQMYLILVKIYGIIMFHNALSLNVIVPMHSIKPKYLQDYSIHIQEISGDGDLKFKVQTSNPDAIMSYSQSLRDQNLERKLNLDSFSALYGNPLVFFSTSPQKISSWDDVFDIKKYPDHQGKIFFTRVMSSDLLSFMEKPSQIFLQRPPYKLIQGLVEKKIKAGAIDYAQCLSLLKNYGVYCYRLPKTCYHPWGITVSPFVNSIEINQFIQIFLKNSQMQNLGLVPLKNFEKSTRVCNYPLENLLNSPG